MYTCLSTTVYTAVSVVGLCQCDAMSVQCNAMSVQCNAVSVQCNAVSVQCNNRVSAV